MTNSSMTSMSSCEEFISLCVSLSLSLSRSLSLALSLSRSLSLWLGKNRHIFGFFFFLKSMNDNNNRLSNRQRRRSWYRNLEIVCMFLRECSFIRADARWSVSAKGNHKKDGAQTRRSNNCDVKQKTNSKGRIHAGKYTHSRGTKNKLK